MPIQFRCQYCRQLLGISKSRAGSSVDCPACGRTLRVPLAEGTAAVSEDLPRQEADQRLQSALEELSSFAVTPSAVSPTSVIREPPVARKNALQSSAGETGTPRDSMRIVPLSAATQSASESQHSSEDELQQLAAISPIEMTAPLIVPELLDDEPSDKSELESEGADDRSESLHEHHTADTPARGSVNGIGPAAARGSSSELASALRELAEQHSGALQSGGDSTRAAKPAASTQRPGNTSWIIGSSLAVAAAFVSGMLVGKTLSTSSKESVSQVETASVAANAKDSSDAAGAELEIEKAPERFVAGRVMYSDGAGVQKPDSSAFVLLVPADRKPGLKLDATPLRELQTSDAKLAIEAAVNVLKGSMTRVADDGTFTVPRRSSGPVKLVVISRHVSRAESEPVDPAVAKTLATWFESPSQLTGRLQVQEKSLPAAGTGDSGPVEVSFSKP